ncbi:MAG: hypothetical protein J2P24_15190 [Streptosporangiales bacterium]|nr:hypothetical protein [Streptosporangiales bacterium]
MGGAIIYVVIIAVWGVVLVPRWLRKHDASTPADGATHVEPENAPGRVLARRRRRQADAAAPTEATDAAVERPAAAARPVRTARPVQPRRRTKRSHAPAARARRLAAHRRLVFAGLVLATAGCGGAAASDALPWWSIGAPLLLVPLYMVHVRRVMVAEHARRRRMRRAEAVAAQRRHDVELAAVLEAGERMGLSAPSSVRAYRAGRLAPGMRFVERGTLFDQHAPEPWQPQPVPLPTYLTAPAAPRAQEPRVPVDDYDDQSQPAEETVVHDFRRVVGG